MYIVKAKYIKTGRVNYIAAYETEADALSKIVSCYRIDERLAQSGEYYYFMVKH